MTILEEAQQAIQDACYRQGIDALYFAIRDELRDQAAARCIEGSEYMAVMRMCIEKAYLRIAKEVAHG